MILFASAALALLGTRRKLLNKPPRVAGIEDECGKCGAAIDPSRRVDFALRDGARVSGSCFVEGTERSGWKKND
jgi:hypothetical protein